MIPLRDDVPSRTTPFINVSSIAITLELGMGLGLERFLYRQKHARRPADRDSWWRDSD